MYDVYLILRSVTYGQIARAALDRANIPGRLIRSPRELAPSGCAYALLISARDFRYAVQLLKAERIVPTGCFQKMPDGSFVSLEP